MRVGGRGAEGKTNHRQTMFGHVDHETEFEITRERERGKRGHIRAVGRIDNDEEGYR